MAEQQRIAVRRRLGGGARANVAAAAAAVINDDLLTERSAEFFSNNARHRVDAAAWRVRHDQRDGMSGVILTGCRAAETDREQTSNKPGTHTPKGFSARFPPAADA